MVENGQVCTCVRAMWIRSAVRDQMGRGIVVTCMFRGFFSFLTIDSRLEHGFERWLTIRNTDKGLWFGVNQSLEVGIIMVQWDTVKYIR